MNMGTMGDKEILGDALATQKQITSSYNTFAGECQCRELRDSFLNILKEEHTIQSDLFDEASSRGWYPVKMAPVTEISAAKQKFTQPM